MSFTSTTYGGAHSDRDTGALHAQMMVLLLEKLGWMINAEKSVLNPTLTLEYTGYNLDSVKMELSLPRDKVDKIVNVCKSLRSQHTATVREAARVIGKLVVTSRAVLPAPLHYRNLQMTQIKALVENGHNYDSNLTVTDQCKEELSWWIQNVTVWNGKSMISPNTENTLEIETDASNIGLGVTCGGVVTQGQFLQEKMKRHINEKELLAAYFTVKAYTRDRTVNHLHIKSDNTMSVAEINQMGSTTSESLMQITAKLWKYCLEKNMLITAEHLKVILNTTADELSRVFRDSSNWELGPKIFKQISIIWGLIHLDLFADRTNHQVNQYVSWRPDPLAMATDALSVKWGNHAAYEFPPFCLIGRCLSKIAKDECGLIMITPLWQTATWWPLALQMSTMDPIMLPKTQKMITGPQGESHPLVETNMLNLIVWKVSGIRQETKLYQKQLGIYPTTSYPQAHDPLTSQPGNGGVAGVVNGKLIQFQPLWKI